MSKDFGTQYVQYRIFEGKTVMAVIRTDAQTIEASFVGDVEKAVLLPPSVWYSLPLLD